MHHQRRLATLCLPRLEMIEFVELILKVTWPEIVELILKVTCPKVDWRQLHQRQVHRSVFWANSPESKCVKKSNIVSHIYAQRRGFLTPVNFSLNITVKVKSHLSNLVYRYANILMKNVTRKPTNMCFTNSSHLIVTLSLQSIF